MREVIDRFILQGRRKQLTVGQANFTFHRRRKIICKAHSTCKVHFFRGVWGSHENLKKEHQEIQFGDILTSLNATITIVV